MDLGGDSSYQGYPYQFYWPPITPSNPDFLDPKMNRENGSDSPFNSGVLTTRSFGSWDGNLGPECRVLDMNVGMYGEFLMKNVWNGIPCTDLLALANTAITNKSSGGGIRGGDGGCSQVNMQFGNQDIGFSHVPESQQDGQREHTKYLFDLNSPPTVAETPLKPPTPKQTRKSGKSRVVSDIINSKDEITDYVADKQNDHTFDLDQPDLIIEQSHDAIWEWDVNEDFEEEEESSDDYNNLKKTPQPKQRRRKHRPKVVIEGQPKSAKKPSTPKPDGSLSVKRKYIRKSIVIDGRSEATDKTMIRQTRNSCRRKINFEEDQNGPIGVRSIGQPGQGTILESQALSPITPNKSEIKHVKRNRPKAKRHINFSWETHDNNDSFDEEEEGRRIKRERSANEDTPGIRYKSLEECLSMTTNSNNPSLHFPAICKKKRTEKWRIVSSGWSLNNNYCNFPSFRYKSPETSTASQKMLAFGHMEGFRKKRTKRLKRVRDLSSLAGMIEVRKWKDENRKRGTCMQALADFSVHIATKKRTKRNITAPSSYYTHWFLRNLIGFLARFRRRTYDVKALISQFEDLGINNQNRDRCALVPYSTRFQEKNAIVLYQHDRSIMPFEDSYNPEERIKLRPKVDLDDETSRVWRLLLEDINSQGIDGIDEDNMKWWEEERNVFRGRAVSFIARMHLVQGDRRFSQWKGSVVDSVIGVFLTQNVSDHLSSSAFMSLAAKYPPKSKITNEPLQDDKSSTSVIESCQLDQKETIKWQGENSNPQPAQDHTSMDADSYEEREVVNSNELCKTSPDSVGLKYKSSVVDTSAINDSGILASFTEENKGVDLASSQNSNDSTYDDHTSSRPEITPKDLDSKTIHASGAIEAKFGLKEGRTKCASEQSVIYSNTLQNEDQDIFNSQMISEVSTVINNQQTHEDTQNVRKSHDMENFAADILEVTESNNIVESSQEAAHKIVESNLEEHGNLQRTESGINKGSIELKKGKSGKTKKKKKKTDWDSLRRHAQMECKRERTPNNMDSVDYEAVRHADVNEIADTIKNRGMNNMLGERIKEFLNRLVRDHGSIDLEWLRDVPPDKTKEYLLSFRGLGLKSVECVRLLTLQHLAFPVDTNVGRIAVRLGWVPLQPLPESLQLHLLELYPILESIQKYLWPRLCKLDQRTLYELHYQMITFGKVFCTKNKPNCNACPMRGECRHFASAFASARLALPAPEEKSIVPVLETETLNQNPTRFINKNHLTLPPANHDQQQQSQIQNQDPAVEEHTAPEPIIEVPATPEPEKLQKESDIEDFYEDQEEIPMIRLNMEAFTQNLQTYMENNMELAEGDMSRALVALTSEAASIPTPKLKNVSQLRTEHHVYELPDSHPLLEGLDKREPDDPCSYLLAIWTPGETAESIQPPQGQCSSQESGMLCDKETCFLCNSIREANSQTVRGTLLIPCRTAMRGSFPLNGTYFQVNEVFADHDSSLNPIDVPRSWLWNLPRRTVYFGTSIPTIFRGLTTKGIQYCFWRGFVCVRGFDQKTRAPRPLMARLHFPVSKLKRSRGPRKTDES